MRTTNGRVALAAIVLAAAVLASTVNHLLAKRYRIGGGGQAGSLGTYRRIGPEEGGQVHCAGSSLMQFGIDWPTVSEHFDRGIENWGIAGSSPEEWEPAQVAAHNTEVTLIGVSYYDLNEFHLCDNRAAFVPFTETVAGLLRHQIDTGLTKRILSQYPLQLSRKAFPTAGRSDAVLIGVRKDLRSLVSLAKNARSDAGSADHGDDEVTIEFNDRGVSTQPLLKFNSSDNRVSDWSEARKQRRLIVMRNHIEGRHNFDGLKSAALRRMVDRASKLGSVHLVVLPVSPSYRSEFIGTRETEEFELALRRVTEGVRGVAVIRLDEVEQLASDSLYSDTVHLNDDGKRIATDEFLRRTSELAAIP